MAVIRGETEKFRLESDRVDPRIRCFPWAKVKISFSDVKGELFQKFSRIAESIMSLIFGSYITMDEGPCGKTLPVFQ